MEWWSGSHGLNKQHTFDDFVLCAEYLIQKNITSPAKLGIRVRQFYKSVGLCALLHVLSDRENFVADMHACNMNGVDHPDPLISDAFLWDFMSCVGMQSVKIRGH